MARKRIKIRPVLITINIVVIIIIIAFYGLRLYKFYKEENSVVNNTGNTTFKSILLNKESLIDKSKGLIYDEDTNTYNYVGEVDDNYLFYSGIMFRIIGLDSSGNIKLISDKSLTLLYSGLNKGFDSSYVYKWLTTVENENNTGIFESALYDKENIIANLTYCSDTISDLSNITCDNQIYSYKYSLLSLYDYNKAGANKSFLNNGEIFYLGTLNDSNQNYYIASTGEIGTDISSTKIHGVRPVITIKSNIKLLSGSGISEDPYIIENHDIKTISDTYLGDIINYSNNEWKVINKLSDGVILALNDVLKDNEDNLLKTFGGSSNLYSNSKNTIGNYLNNTFYESLEDKSLIMPNEWYIGSNSLTNLDYRAKYNNNITLNVGMLSLGDFYVQEIPNILTITPGIESSTIIIVINDKSIAFGDFVATKYNVRPVIKVKNDSIITSGNGVIESPYTIEENKEEISAETSTE